MKPFLTTTLLVLFLCSCAIAQDSDMTKLLDYSRPGAEHVLLGQLSGVELSRH